MTRIVKSRGLLLAAVILVDGCTAPPSDEPAVPTAPEVTGLQVGPGPVDPDAPEEFTATASGLKYRIRREGSGTFPTPADTVRCHYRGWLDDGTEFDASYGGQPFTCSPGGGIIDGWKEGLQLVREGGMIELEIPYQLGYGEDGFPPDIPPRATLHFTMELIRIL